MISLPPTQQVYSLLSLGLWPCSLSRFPLHAVVRDIVPDLEGPVADDKLEGSAADNKPKGPAADDKLEGPAPEDRLQA